MCAFFTGIGLTNLQAMQNVGAFDVVDCSSCADWCYLWMPGFAAMDTYWVAGSSGPGPEATYTGGTWHAVPYGPVMGLYDNDCAVELTMSGQFVTEIIVTQVSPGGGDGTDRYVQANGGGTMNLNFGTGTFTTTVPLNLNITTLRVSNRTRETSVPLDGQISAILLRGQGANPFGADNCVP